MRRGLVIATAVGIGPAALETFTRDGKTLTPTGAGTVRIRTRAGHSFSAALPFSRSLP
jgi:hypothetical protein